MSHFKFKLNAYAEIGTEDPWYALTGVGYLKPENVLADAEQVKEVNDAINIVESFIQACYDEEVIQES